jgi:hypothetical protein
LCVQYQHTPELLQWCPDPGVAPLRYTVDIGSQPRAVCEVVRRKIVRGPSLGHTAVHPPRAEPTHPRDTRLARPTLRALLHTTDD